MHMRAIFLVLLTLSGTAVASDNILADSCNINQKEIVFSYKPQLCTNADCITSEKLIVLGDEIASYFKKSGTNETFKSVGVGNSTNADADVGFIYHLNQSTDVLTDPSEAPALRAALAQLSPGSKYDRYVIRASHRTSVLKLESDSLTELPYVGKMAVQDSTEIKIDSCRSCTANVIVFTSLNNESNSSFNLPVSSCSIRDVGP